jgi:hypothetical protein
MIRHILHEARLTTPGGTFEQHWQVAEKCCPKDLHLVPNRQIKWFPLEPIFFDR